MSDVADRIESVVEHAAETAAAIVEGEALDTAAVIEAAEERIEAAEDIAEAMAHAALQTEIGKRVTEISERLDQWQNASAAEIQRLTERMEAMATELESLKAQPPKVLLSTQPAFETSPETNPATAEAEQVLTATVVTPAANAASEVVQVAVPAPVPQKRSRWI